MKKFDANFVYLNGGGGGDIAIVNYLVAYIKRRNTSSVQLTYFQSLR